MTQETHNLVPQNLPADFIVNLANGLEVMRSALVAMQTRIDLLSAQHEKGRQDVHTARAEINNTVIQLSLMSKDIDSANAGFRQLNERVIIGGQQPALKERVGKLEDWRGDIDGWVTDQDKEHKETVKELVRHNRERDRTRGTNYLTVALTAIGWIVAVVTGLLSVLL